MKDLIRRNKILFGCILYFITNSCSSHNQIIGNKYITKTENRELLAEILNSNQIKFTNKFTCTNIPDSHKEKIFLKEYYFKKNKIILKDSIFKMNLPYFNNSNCKFLSEEYRKTINERAYDGRLIIKNRRELYSLENIDTLKIIKNKMIYIKKEKIGTIGYLFDKME